MNKIHERAMVITNTVYNDIEFSFYELCAKDNLASVQRNFQLLMTDIKTKNC